jgi:CubicO group peptidase (beta-lactamase class C family)
MTTTIAQLPRSAPEAQGIASSAILGFVEAAEQHIHDLHSLMLVRHGHVVAEGWWAPYGPDDMHMLFSLSKSFTSTAIGLAVAEGRLSIDDPVLSFFPDDALAEISENLAAMRVQHLLSMSTGHAEDTMAPLYQHPDGHWVKAFLALPVEYAPGTHFLYNTGATYMLSAIIQQLTGVTLLDYLRPRLLEPLGIEQAMWETCPRGINIGGFGLSITTESIARFGQLYLQQGMWRSRQIVPAAWVAEATASQIDNSPNENIDWAQGYGYQFWRCRHNAYRGDGAFGQFCIVMPDQDAVLAITSGVGDMQAVLNLVWEHILPGLGRSPLPADDTTRTALEQKLAQLALMPPKGQRPAALAEQVSGRTYRFEPNDLQFMRNDLHFVSIRFMFGAAGCEFTIRDQHGEHQIACGDGVWLKGITTFVGRDGPQPVAGAGAWTSEDTYLLKLYYYTTPFCLTMTCRFVEDRLLFDFAVNVSFGPTEFPQLEGRLLS